LCPVVRAHCTKHINAMTAHCTCCFGSRAETENLLTDHEASASWSERSGRAGHGRKRLDGAGLSAWRRGTRRLVSGWRALVQCPSR
jgi:hypothetical protein